MKFYLQHDLHKSKPTVNMQYLVLSEDLTFQLMNPGVYSVTMEPNEVISGELIFQPTEVRLQIEIYLNACFVKENCVTHNVCVVRLLPMIL